MYAFECVCIFFFFFFVWIAWTHPLGTVFWCSSSKRANFFNPSFHIHRTECKTSDDRPFSFFFLSPLITPRTDRPSALHMYCTSDFFRWVMHNGNNNTSKKKKWINKHLVEAYSFVNKFFRDYFVKVFF